MCSPWESLSHLPDGRQICCICFKPKEKAELFRDEDGQSWDVCVPCAPAAGLAKSTP